MIKDQSEVKEHVEEPRKMTQEELIKAREERDVYYTQQIISLKIQKEYWSLLAEIEQYKAIELKAQYEQVNIRYGFNQHVAEMEKSQRAVGHEITQEDLAQNPDLIEQGIKVGDVVQIPVKEEVKEKQKGSRILKK